MYDLRGILAGDAVANGLQDNAYPPVQSVEMGFPEDWVNGIPRHALAHSGAQPYRPIVEAEQSSECALPNDATLQEGRQDGRLVVKRFPKASSVIQMQCEAVVAEDSEGLVVVAIHVAREKIEHRHVHEIEQSSIFVVRRDLPHQRTIVGVVLPLGLLSFVIAPAPRVSPCLSRGKGLVRQKSGKAALEAVRRTAHGMSRVTVITAFAVKAQVAGWTDEEGLQQFAVRDLIDFCRYI